MSIKAARRIRTIGWILFLLYAAGLVYFLFFSEEYGRQAGSAQLRYNLVPFREIRRFVRYAETVGYRAAMLNLTGNIAGFCPFGAILPVLRRSMRSFLKMTGLCALISMCIEVTQMLTRVGVYDVDDIILNTLGGAAGYGIFAVCNHFRRKWYG